MTTATTTATTATRREQIAERIAELNRELATLHRALDESALRLTASDPSPHEPTIDVDHVRRCLEALALAAQELRAEEARAALTAMRDQAAERLAAAMRRSVPAVNHAFAAVEAALADAREDLQRLHGLRDEASALRSVWPSTPAFPSLSAIEELVYRWADLEPRIAGWRRDLEVKPGDDRL